MWNYAYDFKLQKHTTGTSHDDHQEVHAGAPKLPEAFGGKFHQRVELGRRQEKYETKAGEKKTREVIDFEYLDQSGKKLKGEDLDRVKGLKIPPGVTDVYINPDADSAVQATWKDIKDRTVSLYSKKHMQNAAQEKFERLKDFHEALPKIMKSLEKDIDSDDPELRDTARAYYLIAKTGFRVGSRRDTKADKQAYGASTLKGSHAKVDGDKVSFVFDGKKGVRISQTVKDATLARIIKEQLDANKAQGGKQPGRLDLFPNASDGKIREYVKNFGDFKVKDFRTWHGTNVALEEISKRKSPKDEKTFNKWQAEVAERVAGKLGNTKSVCLSSYIDPMVWQKWRQPEWGVYVPPSLKDDD